MNWSLTYSGATKPFADWGLSLPTLEYSSQSPDTATFQADGPAYDSDPIFPYGAAITITDPQGIIRFSGVIIQTPRQGTPTAEGLRYRAAGPWWHLTKEVFQVSAKFLTGQNPTTVAGQLWSRIMLNMDAAGNRVSPKDQITAILTYAIAHGAPFQIGTIRLDVDLGAGPVDVQVPFREVRAVTCAQAIREELRILPDAVCYFDYATALPTFHCQSSRHLPAVTLDVNEGKLVESHTVNPREDLQVPAVVIQYLQTTDVDGVNYNTPIIDLAPPTATGTEFNALVAAVDLKGAKITSTKATVFVEDISAIFNGGLLGDLLGVRAWLRKRLHWLDDRYVNVDMNNVVPRFYDPLQDPEEQLFPPLQVLPNIITEGAVPEWFPYRFRVVRVKFEIRYDQYDAAIPNPDASPAVIPATAHITDQNYRHPVTLDVIMTDAPVGWQTYSQNESIEPAEPVPVGLAAYLYAALSPLTYEGSVAIVEGEATNLLTLGKLLNFTGGRPEWETMAAPTQTLSVDITTGRTSARFGWPQQLGVQDLIEWLRALRPVQRQTSTKEITTGISASDGEISFPKYRTQHDQTQGHGRGNVKQIVGSDLNFVRIFGDTNTDPVNPSAAGLMIKAHEITPVGFTSALASGINSRLGGRFLQFYSKGDGAPANADPEAAVSLHHSNFGPEPQLRLLNPTTRDQLLAGSAALTIAGAASITLQLSDCLDNHGHPLAITIREVDVCVSVSGVPTTWKMKVLCSAPYPPS